MIHVRELIHGALENDLTGDERRRLDAHLAACEECRRADRELRRNDALLSRQDALVPVPAMRPARRRPLRLVIPSLVGVATVALALVAGNALAAWRAGPTAGSPGANTGPVTVSSAGVCGQAQEQAARAATRIERFAVKRMSYKDLQDSGQFGRRLDLDEGALRSTMVCVVEVVGELHGLELGPGASSVDRWAIFVSVAGSGAPVGFTAGSGALPAFFDALPNTRTDLVPGTLVGFVDAQTIVVRLESPKMSEEFGNPARFYANRFTDIRPPNGSLENTGVKPGDRVQIFFERDGRDASGAYPLSTFSFIPSTVPTPQIASPRPNGLPICTAGQLPVLDVVQSPPPGDQEGAGTASAEEAFRRAYPSITSFTMYPLGSDRPSTDPTVLGHGPVWIVAGSDTYIAQYVGAAGLNSWFAHPAKFMGCRDANARPTPTPYVLPADCASVAQAAVPATPPRYPTRTAAEVTSGLKSDAYFRHTLEDVAGVRQDPNPLRDAGVPRCAVDALRTGDPVFVRSYPSDAGLWYVPVIYGDRQVLLVTVGRNEAGLGASGGSVGGSGGMFPPMSHAKAMQVGGTAEDPAASAELVFARVSGAQLVSWRIVRQSGAVFYVIPGYPGAGPDGAVLAEAQVNVGP